MLSWGDVAGATSFRTYDVAANMSVRIHSIQISLQLQALQKYGNNNQQK
jgi:hypothetical protein